MAWGRGTYWPCFSQDDMMVAPPGAGALGGAAVPRVSSSAWAAALDVIERHPNGPTRQITTITGN